MELLDIIIVCVSLRVGDVADVSVWVINCGGQSTLRKRSTFREGHLVDNTGFKYPPLAHISIYSSSPLFVRLGVIKLFSQESSGPRRREGDRSKNSFEGRFTAKAKVRVCFLRASRRSPRRAGKVRQRTHRQLWKPLDTHMSA